MYIFFLLIDYYEYGIKLMYKLLKNKNKTNLHSDAERKGRGMIKKIKMKTSLITLFPIVLILIILNYTLKVSNITSKITN